MKYIIVLIGTLLLSAACQSSADSIGKPACPRGAVLDEDVLNGEQRLGREKLIRINLVDQDSIKSLGRGKQYSYPKPAMVEKYNLKNRQGFKWISAPARGFFGIDRDDADKNYEHNTGIEATYFPATKKVVISVMTPDAVGNETFEYWVFVQVPEHFSIVTYDCGTFR